MQNKLSIRPDFSEYLIFGISSHLPEYIFGWQVSKDISCDFERIPSLQLPQTDLSYTIYSYQPDDLLMFYIIANYSKGIPLIFKQKHFHYFFLLHGQYQQNQKLLLKSELKKAKDILLVTEIESDDMPIFFNVLELLELHLNELSRQAKEDERNLLPWKKSIRKG